MSAASKSRTRLPVSKRSGPRTQSTRFNQRTSAAGDITALNEAPINQHALKLLPKWALKPDASQLHLLTLVSTIQFTSKTDSAMLEKMRREWEPSAVLEYFSHVEAFEDLFLAQDRPLEAAQVVLAAVNLIAQPQRYLPSFQLV